MPASIMAQAPGSGMAVIIPFHSRSSSWIDIAETIFTE